MRTSDKAVRYQSAWYIDTDSGDDGSVADSLTRALKTWGEVASRLEDGRVNQDTTFYIKGDMPSSDTLDLSAFNFDRRYNVVIRGIPTTITTGTLTAKTDRNGATGQTQRISDSGVSSWTPYINNGHMIEMTSGAANGKRAWIVEDLGSGDAITSTFYDQTSISEAAPGVGDTYKIIKLPAIARSTLNTISYGKTFFVYDLDLYMSSPSSNYASPASINFKCCRFYASPYVAGFVRYHNTQFQILQGYGGLTLVYAGVVYQPASPKNSNEVEHGQGMQLANGTLFYKCTMNPIHRGVLRIFDAGVIGATGDAVDLQDQGSILVGNLWGEGSTGYGVNTRGSGKIFLNAAMGAPTITGASGDVRLNQTTKTWDDLIADGYTKDAASDACVSPY